ncbi:MAG: hypothetical protein M0010_21775 [Actinomycetota bacterium]|nr:hypothetical protein [Actinomycetota bacterium]
MRSDQRTGRGGRVLAGVRRPKGKAMDLVGTIGPAAGESRGGGPA